MKTVRMFCFAAVMAIFGFASAQADVGMYIETGVFASGEVPYAQNNVYTQFMAPDVYNESEMRGELSVSDGEAYSGAGKKINVNANSINVEGYSTANGKSESGPVSAKAVNVGGTYLPNGSAQTIDYVEFFANKGGEANATSSSTVNMQFNQQ